ncbi:lysine-specific histone demethylase Aof2 [Pseudozyma hubeiensis SY62]|uniref:Lysine-specific histone demethylase Aof2 n=1 Tax=Pseudozyma hubeiensis (strain SY62) TaxID=1305764 RepID=R9PGL9_PSEHS|nr:lysine-specific histone demethylase Aof2 [Pseudozyma hubeiensis SY62]GAC97245.1 lysine-specific histone demethylase Aof2 [Pseudozyma hubeiensis SY62]
MQGQGRSNGDCLRFALGNFAVRDPAAALNSPKGEQASLCKSDRMLGSPCSKIQSTVDESAAKVARRSPSCQSPHAIPDIASQIRSVSNGVGLLSLALQSTNFVASLSW